MYAVLVMEHDTYPIYFSGEICSNISINRCALIPKQAYPAADEASPAAVGKLFVEQICTWYLRRGLEGSLLLHRRRTSKKGGSEKKYLIQ